MRSLTMIRLVASREIRDRLGNRAFVAGSAITLVAILALVILPGLFGDDGPSTLDLGVVGDVPTSFEDAAVAAGDARDTEVTIVPLDDRDAANLAVEDGDVDAVVIDGDTLLVEDDASDLVLAVTQQAVQQADFLARLANAGVEPSEIPDLLAASEPLDVVTPTGSTDEREAGFGVALFATVLLFLMVQMNGGALLTGTIEEKSSRVVEVLLGSVRPWQLLAGKLAGISTLAIAQLALYMGAGLGANEVVGTYQLPPAAGEAALYGLVMFVVGFGFYAAMYAVAGSMASSIEDAQSSAGPLGFLVAIIYGAVIIGVIPNPDGLLARVLTFVPPSAPFAVPARVASGAIATWEIALAALLTALGTAIAIRVAGRLYSAAILAGGTLSWRAVVRAEPIA